jgi:hypothetical protein
MHQALVAAPSSCVNATLNLTEAALAGFTVHVTCSPSDHVIGGMTYQAFHIGSFAQFGSYGTPDYVAKRLTRTVSNAPLP